MFKIFPTVSNYFAKLFSSQNLIGFVEFIEWTSIRGWVLRNDRRLISLVLRIDGENYPLTPNWLERLDVAQKHGLEFKHSGYNCILSAELEVVLKDAVKYGQKIEVLADGTALKNIAKLPKLEVQLQPEPLGIAIDSVEEQPKLLGMEIDELELKGEIEEWGHFTISGWIMLNERPFNSICLLCNGKAIDCTVLRVKRPDISQNLGVLALESGFKIELPGYLWENLSGKEDALIEIQIDDQTLDIAPIVFNKEIALSWIDDILNMKEGPEKQYLSLLALEHVRFGRLFELLQSDEKKLIKSFSQKMKLDDFACFGIEEPGEQEAVPTESASTLLLWKAMRSLNDKLIEADGKGKVFDPVVEVLRSHRLLGEAKEWFLFLATQLTCETGEFQKMRGILSFDKLYELAQSEIPQKMTLGLPALVADGLIDKAISTLTRLRTHLKDGWLHTYCIRAAFDELYLLESEGEIDINKAEKLRYEFFSLLDAHKGEWFSRLYDRELIKTMVRMIDHIDFYTDYMRKDLVEAAIRNYGLCPGFWEELALSNHGDIPAEFLAGYNMWEDVSSIIQNWLPASEYANHDEARAETEEQIASLIQPLSWFYLQGNLDTVIFLRELIMGSLPALNNNLGHASEQLIYQLLSIDWAEALRIAAFPVSSANLIKNKFNETSGSLFFERVRKLTENKKSAVYELQCAAAETLKKVELAKHDTKGLADTLKDLENKAIFLSNWQGAFLGADLLVSGYIYADRSGLDGAHFLMRLLEVVRRVIVETHQDYYLPAPVLAALDRVRKSRPDPLVVSLLHEIDQSIRTRFLNKHELTPAAPEKLILTVDTNGWPRDTLVVISSTRERIGKAQLICQAWLADLKDRSIPYIFVVAGNEDSFQDNVLTINVPEHPENQIEKTFKLFDWVYRKTNAQFVIKIEDDCYLNVSRYFDTLSYRKHFYYGRIIHKGIGSVDRAGLSEKVTDAPAIKFLDKSPEPSNYADNDGAYSLSRFAIASLLQAKITEAGTRIAASSTKDDKLVGDLLALINIYPSNEDYVVFERYCTSSESLPIAKGENSFYPCKDVPTKVVHLDSVHDLVQAKEIAEGSELWPKKIWPTCWLPSLKHNSNQLELITECDRIWPILEHKIAVVAVVRNEMIMLPHFLEHYRKLGVKCFIFADNCSDDGTREYLYEQPDTVLYSVDTEYRLSHYGVAWQQAILGNLCLGKWVVLADADEFLIYKDCEHQSLEVFVEDVESKECDSVFTHMIDMYPFGDLDDACFEKGAPFDVAPYFDKKAQIELKFGGGQFSNSRNYVNGLRHRIAPSRINAYVSQKYALFRYQPWMRLTEGIHYASNMKLSTDPVYFAHFKYHAGFKKKVLAEIKRNQHFNGAEEYRRYASMLAEGHGGFGKESITAKYHDSTSFVNLFDMKTQL